MKSIRNDATFLKTRQHDPLFLFVAYNGPYGLGQSMTEIHENRHTAFYKDQPLTSFPREGIHSWLYNNRQIINNETSIKGYASAVSGVDDGVGALSSTIEKLGLTSNTLAVFT